MSGDVFACICPLPDEGCPCEKESDCLGRCQVPGPDGSEPCKSAAGAVCARSTLGCHCVVDENGKAGTLCAD